VFCFDAKDNDDMVRHVGNQFIAEMVKQLWQHGFLGIHIFTLNNEKSVSQLLEMIGFSKRQSHRSLPYKPVCNHVHF
jgi:5,10-methylenetetrahydrofolate reductase